MEAWIGLLKKEVRLMRSFSLIALGVVLGNFLSVSYFSFHNHVSGFILTWVIYLLVAHMFYLVLYIPFSLGVEGKGGLLWQPHPQSGWKRLSAKYAGGVYSFTISLIFTVLLGMISSLMVPRASFTWSSYFPSGIYLYLHLLFISTVNGAWILFGWILYQTIGKYSDFLAKLSIVGVVLLSTWLLMKWQGSHLYTLLFNWGPIQLSAVMPRGVTMEVFPTSYIGNYVYYLVVSMILVMLAGRLLDKNNEW